MGTFSGSGGMPDCFSAAGVGTERRCPTLGFGDAVVVTLALSFSFPVN